MSITFNLYRNFDGTLDGRYPSGDKPDAAFGGTPALAWSAPSGLVDGETLTITTDGTYNFGTTGGVVWSDELQYSEPAGQAPTSLYRNVGGLVLDNQVTLANRARSWRGSVKDHLSPQATITKTPEIYCTWWQRFSCATNDPLFFNKLEARSDKYIRVWDDASGTGTRISWTQYHMTYGSGSQTSFNGGTNFAANTWSRMELHATPTNITAWKDGVIFHQKTDQIDQSVLDYYWAQTGYDMAVAGEAIQPFDWWLSDLYRLPDQSRVELSNSATWNSGQILKYVQSPSNWSSNSIDIKLNQADLGQDVYLYVLDATGVPVSANGVKL